MKAKGILHTKEVKGDEIVEIKIWQVPNSADKTYGIMETKKSLIILPELRI